MGVRHVRSERMYLDGMANSMRAKCVRGSHLGHGNITASVDESNAYATVRQLGDLDEATVFAILLLRVLEHL